jgi:hypothetical protein
MRIVTSGNYIKNVTINFKINTNGPILASEHMPAAARSAAVTGGEGRETGVALERHQGRADAL